MFQKIFALRSISILLIPRGAILVEKTTAVPLFVKLHAFIQTVLLTAVYHHSYPEPHECTLLSYAISVKPITLWSHL